MRNKLSVQYKKENNATEKAKLFCQTWNRSDSVIEVAKKLSISRQSAYNRKTYLTKKGIKGLKRFGFNTVGKLNVEEVNKHLASISAN